MPGNYRGRLCYWEHFFSLGNLMCRTVTVPLNSINILAQEQFGSGCLAEVKILYHFMDEICESCTMKDTAVADIVTLSDIFDYES